MLLHAVTLYYKGRFGIFSLRLVHPHVIDHLSSLERNKSISERIVKNQKETQKAEQEEADIEKGNDFKSVETRNQKRHTAWVPRNDNFKPGVETEGERGKYFAADKKGQAQTRKHLELEK